MTLRPADQPPCVNSPLDFTAEPTERVSHAEVAETREAAAHLCGTCPFRMDCGAQAEAARLDPAETVRPFGVLAGLFYDGTTRPPMDLLMHQQIRQMVADGICDAVMAEKLGVTHHQIRHARDRMGLPSTVKRRRMPLRAAFKHGTKSGYLAHKRRGETPCDDCRAGLNAYNRAWAARRRAAA